MVEQEKRVWLLTTGEYSDFSVQGVFDDEHKQQAEEIAALMGGDVSVSFILNGMDAEKPPEGMVYFPFIMFRDGSTSSFDHDEYLLDGNGKRRRQCYSLDCCERYNWYKASHWRLSVGVYARDKKHAVKIANEIRAQLLANGNKPFWKDIP